MKTLKLYQMKKNNNYQDFADFASNFKWFEQPKAEYDETPESVNEFLCNDIAFRFMAKKWEGSVSSACVPDKGDGLLDGLQAASVGSRVDLGYGYAVYPVKWQKEDGCWDFAYGFYRQFYMKGDKSPMTLAEFVSKYEDRPVTAVFTEKLMRIFMETYDKVYNNPGLFYVAVVHSGFVSVNGGDVRWLFEKGMAVGRKYENYCYFDAFTEEINYLVLESRDLHSKQMERIMWQVKV